MSPHDPATVPGGPSHRVAEVYMFDTCTHRCGYCWLAESGRVLDAEQLKPFHDPEFIDAVAGFFNSRTTAEKKWLLTFTGGEPLIAPNLSRLCTSLFAFGNKVAFYTALLVDERSPGFRFLMEHSYPEVDYIVASMHPEDELNEKRHIAKFELLKQLGHRILLKYVGSPARMDRLDHVANLCKEIGVSFYPTTMLSNTYPQAYTEEERQKLSAHFSMLTQYIQLEGGIDTSTSLCHAGSKLIAVNLQTGNITPCITVSRPLLGNIFSDKLELFDGPIACPEMGISCSCEVHFQQNIIVGAEDHDNFETQKLGYSGPQRFDRRLGDLQASGVRFYRGQDMGMGDVSDDWRLIFSREEVQARFAPQKAVLQMERRVAQRVGVADLSCEPSGEAVTGEPVQIEVEAEVRGGKLARIQLWVNEAVGAPVHAKWKIVDSRKVSGARASAAFRWDTRGVPPGEHRIGVNVGLADGDVLWWYQQPARSYRLRASDGD